MQTPHGDSNTVSATGRFTGRATENTEHVNGVDLFTRSVGEGPDLVVLHGGPGASHLSLLPGFDALAASHRLRYYDQRGCGHSRTTADKALSFRDHVQDLVALLDSWELDRVRIAGHSWGALLALLLAISCPERVGRLALISPAAITYRDREKYQHRLAERQRELQIMQRLRAIVSADLRRKDPASFRQRTFELTLEPFLKNPEAAAGAPPVRISQRARTAIWRSLGKYDLSPEVVELRIPALVIHGKYDPIPLSASERTAALLGAKLVEFDNSGHMPFLEETNRFAETVGDFLKDC